MTNLSSVHDQLPHQSSLPTHSYDKLGSFTVFQPAAVSLTYSIPSLATSVHHEGSLYKRSSILKQWHQSYYVLDDLTLVIYPSETTYQHIASQPPSPSSQQYKRLDLSEYGLKSLSPSAHNRPYCFTLASRDTSKEHLFAAPSEQARTGWIDAIHKAMKVAEVARRKSSNSKEKAVYQSTQDGEKSELVSGTNRGKREEVMSGRGLYSNALITSSSSSSLASITHNVSASTSSNSLSSAADMCHSCHSPFTLTMRPVPCTRCARSFCDGCAAHTVTMKGGEMDEDRRVCNRCHEGMVAGGMNGLVSGELSGLGGSRMTTKNGLSDDVDDAASEPITITIGAPTYHGSSASTVTTLLPPLPPLNTSTSSSEPGAVLLTNPTVEATRELVSPAPNPSSPPPSPLSPIHAVSHIVAASRPASPTSTLQSPSSTSLRHVTPPLKLSVRVPDSREKDIVVLSREEIERIEAERRRKGLPDGGARMGSVVIGAPVKQQPVVKQPAAVRQPPASNHGEMTAKKPWYVCGCGL